MVRYIQSFTKVFVHYINNVYMKYLFTVTRVTVIFSLEKYVEHVRRKDCIFLALLFQAVHYIVLKVALN